MQRVRVRRCPSVPKSCATTSIYCRIVLALCAALVAEGCEVGKTAEPSVSEQTLNAEEGCLKDPGELGELDQACFELPCICGSHCNQESDRCEFDCIWDDDCGLGQSCNFEGFCITPGDPLPTPSLSMEVDPLGYRLRPDRGGEIEPVTFHVTLSTFGTPPDQVSLRVVPSDLLGAPEEGVELPTIQCSDGAGFEESCEVTSWTFTGQTVKTATAEVQVHLPPTQVDRAWSLEFRSNQAVNSVVTVSAQIQPFDPVTADGYYTGWLFPENSPTERYPLRAMAKDGKVVIIDDTRVMSKLASISMRQRSAPEDWELVPWIDSLDGTPNTYVPVLLIVPSEPVVDRNTGKLGGSLGLYVVWQFELTLSEDPAPFEECMSDEQCGAGKSCHPDVNRCLPSNPVVGGFAYPEDARMKAWVDVSGPFGEAPDYLTDPHGARSAGRYVCYDPAAPGDYLGNAFITVGNGDRQADVGEIACAKSGGSRAFPFLAARQ